MSTPDPVQERFQVRDFVEIALGGSIMAFPVAVTQEVWDLGSELSLMRALLFAVASLLVLAVLIYVLHEHGKQPVRRAFLQRLAATYGATLVISAVLLAGVNRIDLLHAPLVALKRTILVAFPASFAATAVDSFGSKR